MTRKNNSPKESFKLIKYFGYTSFMVLLAFTLLLNIFVSHQSKRMLLEKTKEYALLFAENLNHQVFQQFVLPTTFFFGKIKLRDPVQQKRLDIIVKDTIHSFNIEAVNIYDLDNVLVYSTNPENIGKKGKGGRDYRLARKGKHVFRLLIDKPPILGLTIPKAAKLKTTIPFRMERIPSVKEGSILGVFEIVQDISMDYQKIIKNQYLLIAISTLSMGMVFIILVLIVRRGERIMLARAEALSNLEKELHKKEKLAALGEMVAAVSHEIRNPLGIIRGTAEILEKKMKELDPEDNLAHLLIEESDRLNQVLTEFLDFARPKEVKLEPLDINKIIEQNIDFLSSELERHHIEIKKDLSDDLPKIMADGDLLYRAFQNIFFNAIQAMPDGGTLSVLTRNSSNGKVTIEIEDTGIGIPKDIQEKIFDPFFTTKEKGSGLGLSIVMSIIQAHQGTIDVKSPPLNKETGTLIKIILPKGE